jgi:hypothetical protein
MWDAELLERTMHIFNTSPNPHRNPINPIDRPIRANLNLGEPQIAVEALQRLAEIDPGHAALRTELPETRMLAAQHRQQQGGVRMTVVAAPAGQEQQQQQAVGGAAAGAAAAGS